MDKLFHATCAPDWHKPDTYTSTASTRSQTWNSLQRYSHSRFAPFSQCGLLLRGCVRIQQQYRARDYHGRAANSMRRHKAGTTTVPTKEQWKKQSPWRHVMEPAKLQPPEVLAATQVGQQPTRHTHHATPGDERSLVRKRTVLRAQGARVATTHRLATFGHLCYLPSRHSNTCRTRFW